MPHRAFLITAIFLIIPSVASAHGLDARCRYRDGQIIVQVYYDSDEPAANADVVVHKQDGATVAQGKTDANGEWRFPHPGIGTFEVVADTVDKHRVKKTIRLTATELAPDEVVSDGPPRESFTGYKWVKIGIGLAAVGLFALALRFAVRRPRPPAGADAVQ